MSLSGSGRHTSAEGVGSSLRYGLRATPKQEHKRSKHAGALERATPVGVLARVGAALEIVAQGNDRPTQN